MAHRLQPKTSLHGVSHRTLLCLRSSIVRSRAPTLTQARALWWWSRHGNDWAASHDENLDEKVRRHQRILRHRYSKMLRRKSMWERDTTSRFSWPWRMPGRWMGSQLQDVQHLSSTKASRTKLEEQQDDREAKDGPLATFHRDFESFKQAVDKAIERDPYGALFGRRLHGPTSANNSSWTSFSWIWDPKEIKEEQVDSNHPPPQSSRATPEHASRDPPSPGPYPGAASPQPIPSAQSVAEEEYEYDPISMRKVLKSKAASAVPLNKSLFDTLFSEHGVDIPIKTYKPHKVYGHAGKPKDGNVQALPRENTKNSFETSRKQELQAMKASALGNTIDTSAQFGGKVKQLQLTPSTEPPKRRSRYSGEPIDDAPLFSGTTYEDKSAELLAIRKPKSNWLLDEGFKSAKAMSEPDRTFDIPVKKYNPKIEPSLDRMSAQKTPSTIIQPALDRHLGTKGPSATRAVQGGLDEKTEDVDLLRPHMVRANTKTVRPTKQDIELQKQEARSKLENDFAVRQSAKETEMVETPSYRFSGKLDTVWKHVQNNPDGIVAKTMRSMGIGNDNFKKYGDSSKSRTGSLETLTFEDDTSSNVASIYKPPTKAPKPVTTFTPSQEVLRAEAQNLARRADTHDAISMARSESLAESVKAGALAKDIRRAYESEDGELDVQHRQNTAVPAEPLKAIEQTEKLHPLKTATVKNGVPRYPAIEAHVSNFEPKFARLVDNAKKFRREMHEAQIHYRDLKDRMQRSPWSEIDNAAITTPSFALLKDDPAEEDYPQGLDGPFPSAPTEVKSQPNFATTPKFMPKIQEPVFTPPGSSVWNDEQPPPISELVDSRSQFNAYVLLRYSQKHNSVQIVPISDPPPNAESGLESFNRLDNAAKFFSYFPALVKEGYEMVSGGHDFLLFKRSMEAIRPSVKMEEIAKETPHRAEKQQPAVSGLLKPATSPQMAQRLKQEQELINSFIKVEDVKHTHGLNSFEVHSILSQLAAQVQAGRAEGAKGLGGVLGKLKALRSRALTMDSVEFNKQAETLIREVQIARAAQPFNEINPSASASPAVAEPAGAQQIQAATVLDDIPQPTPGPAAPTAPPINPGSMPAIRQESSVRQEPATKPEPTTKEPMPIPESLTEQEAPKRQLPLSKPGEGPRARVKRQEDGFSGTLKAPPYRPTATSRTPQPPPPDTGPEPEPEPGVFYESPPAPRLSAWNRFTRLIKRTVITIVGAGVGAYVVGVIAEGIGAEQQRVGGDGPRRKVVLPPSTRPGVYSTENSR